MKTNAHFYSIFIALYMPLSTAEKTKNTQKSKRRCVQKNTLENCIKIRLKTSLFVYFFGGMCGVFDSVMDRY